MSYPLSHKTVVVLDHSPHFLAPSCQQVEFDIFTKAHQPGIIPLAPITKSLWTTVVESTMEYCRIVWDIYPSGKLIRFVVSDTEAHCLNTWSQEGQNLGYLLEALADIGVPSQPRKKDECSIMHGLTAAIKALCECSEVQHEKRTSLTESAGSVVNRGRVLCITSVRSESHVRTLEKCFLEALNEHNKLAAGSDNLMPVHQCEFTLILTFPIPTSEESTVHPIQRRELSPVLTTEMYMSKAGRFLAATLCYLVQRHFNLASTTVTGIPMKEEQNAKSSANYDVELLHPVGAHSEFFKTGFANTEGAHVKTVKEGLEYDSVILKWCTPRPSTVDLQYCTAAHRITPVEVNSRPSSCLTNFLLSDRAVMLELPRKSGSRLLSHMLVSHGGEIYIHTLATSRSILEDPPSISEGSGGRVTDYRINDFGEFMKDHRLAPFKSELAEGELPIEKAKNRLSRQTLYWPMVISHTTIFNMTPPLEPLLSLLKKETLTTDEVIDCKKVIYNLIGMESKGTPLPMPVLGTRGKGPKREEQYRILWKELETYIRAYCTTAEHHNILDCLLDCRKPSPDTDSTIPSNGAKVSVVTTSSGTRKAEKGFIKEDKLEAGKTGNGEIGWKERVSQFSDMDIHEDGGNSFKVPPAKKVRLGLQDDRGRFSGSQSLLTLWTNRVNAEHSKRHREFSGRLAAGNGSALLYQNLNSDQNNQDD